MTTEATVATAEALTEPSRDLPNAPADRQALGLVNPYLGMVAWPTVFVAITIVSAFATVTMLGVMHITPSWLGLILNTFILYLDQTPLHEACHGNIAGKDSKMLWLNHVVGYVCQDLPLHASYPSSRHPKPIGSEA
jgi:beta-carotene hydroxylase